MILSASLRRVAAFWAAFFVRARLLSSPKVTSSDQCNAFSTPQCPRTALAKRSASKGQAANIISSFTGVYALYASDIFDHAEAAQSFPQGLVLEPVYIRGVPVSSGFVTPAMFFHGLKEIHALCRHVIGTLDCTGRNGVVEIFFYFLQNSSVVTFDCKHVIACLSMIIAAISF